MKGRMFSPFGLLAVAMAIFSVHLFCKEHLSVATTSSKSPSCMFFGDLRFRFNRSLKHQDQLYRMFVCVFLDMLGPFCDHLIHCTIFNFVGAVFMEVLHLDSASFLVDFMTTWGFHLCAVASPNFYPYCGTHCIISAALSVVRKQFS